jgi:ABC-type oligopeptide transport system substrate-binding subunit
MAALTAGLVFAAACGGDDDDDADSTPGAGETPAATSSTGSGDQAPADQQKIVIAQPEPQFVDPHKSNFEQDIGVERMLFRGLYNLTDDGSGGVKIEPGMAEGDPTVSILSGGGGLASPNAQAPAVYTVKLRSDAKWSDGEPVTAADFVFGFTRACDPAVASPYQYLLGAGLGDLAGCDALAQNEDPAQTDALKAAIGAKAIDDTTLEITLNKEIPTFKTIFALWTTFPARQDVIEANGDAWTDPANIVTNGPFTLSELVPNSHLVLVPNESWTGKKPALQEIRMNFVDDLGAAFGQFQNDEELQMTEILATDVAVANGAGLEDNVLVVPSARITTIETQMTDATLSNFGVRLAISQAIDREALVSAVFDNVHAPAYYWVVEGLTGHQGNEAFEPVIGYDPEQAPTTLADAGFPNGEGIPTLSWTARDNEQKRNEFAFIQKALKDTLNINIEARFVDGDTRSALFNAEDFQLFPGGWQLDYPDIENPLVGLFNTDGGNNKYNCSDPDVDAAFEEAANATSEEARIEAYQKVEKNIIEKLCGVIPLYQDARPYVVSTRIGGVVANGTIDAGLPGNYCVECWFVKAD